MDNKQFIAWAEQNDACAESVDYLRKSGVSAAEFWATSDRTDWMLWMYERCNPDKMTCVKIAADIADAVVHLTIAPEARMAIDAARAWIENPSDAARVAARAAAWDAAWAAARAASAASADAWAAARAAQNKINADIVRKHIPTVPEVKS